MRTMNKSGEYLATSLLLKLSRKTCLVEKMLWMISVAMISTMLHLMILNPIVPFEM